MDSQLQTAPRLTRIEGGSGIAFSHPCHVCGNPLAPFGEGVALLKSQPGRWTCWEHWPGRADADERRSRVEADKAAVLAETTEDAF